MQDNRREDEGFVPAQFRVQIGEKIVVLTTPEPTGHELLVAGGIDPKEHYLVQEFAGGDAIPVDAEDSVDVRRPGIERFLPVARKKRYPIYVDESLFDLEDPRPTGVFLLGLVNLKPCGYELVQKFLGRPDMPVDPGATVDIRKPGIEKFYSVEREEVKVTVLVANEKKTAVVPRGEVAVALIREKAGVPPQYQLYTPLPGPMPLADDATVIVKGCEVFPTQVRQGSSS